MLWSIEGLLGALLLLYFTFDKQALHYSRTAHRIFWGVVTACILLLLAPNFGKPFLFIIVGIVFASFIETHIQVDVKLKRFSSKATSTVEGTPEARGLAARIDDIVEKINKGRGITIGVKQMVSLVRGKLRGRRTLLLETLESASPEELNFVIARVNCPKMFEVCGQDIHDLLSQPEQRLPCLNTLSRAIVVDALQKLGLRHRPKRQAVVMRIFLNTHGQQLSLLKCHLDDNQGFNNTWSLLFIDLQGWHQKQVLKHIESEGSRLRNQSEFTSKHGTLLKIVSDFDDTMACSGAKPKFAGCDSRLPKRTFYPGIFSLFQQLDECFSKRVQQNSGTQLSNFESFDHHHHHHQPGSNFVLLSARPRSYKGYSEEAFTRSVIKPLLTSQKLRSFPVILMGSLDAVPRAIARHIMGKSSLPAWRTLKASVFESLALQKILCFEEYAVCYPEASFVFFGDNGQGDLFFAETINQNPDQHKRLSAAFIHLVRPLCGSLSGMDLCSADALGETEGFIFQNTHVGMAIEAHALEFLDDEALGRVALGALMDFREILARYRFDEESIRRYATDLKRDVLKAMRLLPDRLKLKEQDLHHLDFA